MPYMCLVVQFAKTKKNNTTEKNISYSNISHQYVTVIRNMCRERCKLFWLLCTFYLSTVTYISRLKYLTFCWVYVVSIEKLRPKILSTFTTFCNTWIILYNEGKLLKCSWGFFFCCCIPNEEDKTCKIYFYLTISKIFVLNFIRWFFELLWNF